MPGVDAGIGKVQRLSKGHRSDLMKRFDSAALYNAVDQKRQSLGMTWADVAREIHVSASTIRHAKEGGRMEVDGKIAMVDWLGEKVETFVRETAR